MDLMQAINVSAGGMYAQSTRMKVAAENIANADSVQNADGTGPYRAKQVYFKSVLNRQTGATEVAVSNVQANTKTPLKMVYNPSHQLADSRGYVAMPNVETTLENINMREAKRSYEANLAAIQNTREMITQTLDILR